MNPRTKKTLLAVSRWGIAVVGIWIVLWNMNLRDSVLLLNPATNTVTQTVLAKHAEENAGHFDVIDPQSHKTMQVDRSLLVNPPTQKTVRVDLHGKEETVALLGMDLQGQDYQVARLLIKPTGSSNGQWILPTETVPPFVLSAPRPRVTPGIESMVQHASPWLLVLALLVFPINFIITSYRWHKLLQAVEIDMTLARAFVINMVGSFYNSFLLGSTGGDVIKAYYAAKQTHHKTRAVMSVLIDRILGLLALIMLAGIMASYQYVQAPLKTDPTAQACLRVAIVCVLMLAGVGVGLAIMFQPTLRVLLGLEFILRRMPMQQQISHARQVMKMYRRRPVLMLWALLITLPVHITTAISAMLACQAFGLKIQPLYYFVVVPIVVLAGSIPISPQGAGVMEVTAYQLMKSQGASVNDAVALTMSIRVVQILWNLTGGIFVLRGGYHAPTASEQKEMEEPDEEENEVRIPGAR